MYNVIINNVKCLFLQNSFFYLRDVIGGTQRSKNPVWFELPQCWTAHHLTVVKTKCELS